MKTPLFFITVLTLVFSSVVNAKSIDSLDKHETELITCLSNAKGKESEACLIEHLAKKVDVSLESIIKAYLTVIGNNSVFKIYKVNEVHKGDYQVKKDFIVENTKGKIFVFSIIYRNKLGKWIIKNVSVSSSKSKISEVLGF